MSYPIHVHSDAALLDSVKYINEEKKSEDVLETAHLQMPSSELSPLSSTIMSITTLQNIAVSTSAPHAILPSARLLRPSATKEPYEMQSRPSICRNDAQFCDQKSVNKSQPKQSSNQTIRRGKWTPEEEEYANAVVREFNSGYLDAEPGTTLRIYLSAKLHCDPMRITKKFTGNDSIGKRVFHPMGRIGDGLTREARDAQANLDNLYEKWKKKLDHQDQEYTRKAMAAQAVSRASSLSDGLTNIGDTPRVFSIAFNPGATHQKITENDVHITAMWLSCASEITKASLPIKIADIDRELQTIARLLEEAPVVLATAADLSRPKGIRLHQPYNASTIDTVRKRKFADDTQASDSPTNPMKLLASISSHAVPVPILDDTQNNSDPPSKPSVSVGDLEDAQAFVHFLESMN